MEARRIAVVGNSGSGKTSLGRRLADRLELPYVELDAIYHQPGWEPLERDEFRRRVAAVAARDGWVIDGNYSAANEPIWERAQAIVWLDLPRATVMRRVIARTLRRVLTREELWNDNREPWSNLYRWDPEQNIIRWAWVRHPVIRERYTRAMRDRPDLEWVRLRSPDEVEAFLAEL